MNKMSESKHSKEKETLLYPLMEDLQKHVPSKYELVLLASLRAKQIIYKARRGVNPEGELPEEALEEDSKIKPLTQALVEIAEGKLERDKLYLFEYLESFHRGAEAPSLKPPITARDEFEFIAPEKLAIEEEEALDEEKGVFGGEEIEEE